MDLAYSPQGPEKQPNVLTRTLRANIQEQGIVERPANAVR